MRFLREFQINREINFFPKVRILQPVRAETKSFNIEDRGPTASGGDSMFCRFRSLVLSGLIMAFFFLALPVPAEASYVDTNLNTFVHDAVQSQIGTAGQAMQFHVRIGYNGVNGLNNPGTDEITNVKVRLSNDQNYLTTENNGSTAPKNNPYRSDDDDEDNELESAQHDAYNEGYNAGVKAYTKSVGLSYPVDGGRYPFEINASIFTQEQDLGTLKKGEYRDISFNVNVRSDTNEGYYGVPFTITYDAASSAKGGGGSLKKTEFVNVYIQKAGDIVNQTTTTADKAFAIGENEETPNGNYPAVMNYNVSLRNQKSKKLYDVKVTLNSTLAKDMEPQATAAAKATADKGFPFEINDSNYTRSFTTVDSNEVIEPSFSMAIRANAAPAYYPLSYTITYKDTPDAAVTHSEDYVFYVNVHNSTMIDTDEELGSFDENSRTKARLIVSAYHTEPAEVYAGQPFTLFLEIQNASTGIPASNILLNLQSEKVSDSAVFSMADGSSSIVLDSLAAGEKKEVSVTMTAAPGVTPRSYTVTIEEKYDSPQFKNADEKTDIAVPVKQESRVGFSSFDVTPSAISVGEQADVTFSVNNTGKVTLYNVEADFAADSIESNMVYIGNINPGGSGAVDIMLTGAQATADDGKIPVTIRYEDVDGNSYTKDTTVTLMVSEETESDYPMESEAAGEEDGSGFPLKAVLAGTAAGTVILILLIRAVQKKRKKTKDEDEDI